MQARKARAVFVLRLDAQGTACQQFDLAANSAPRSLSRQALPLANHAVDLTRPHAERGRLREQPLRNRSAVLQAAQYRKQHRGPVLFRIDGREPGIQRASLQQAFQRIGQGLTGHVIHIALE